MARSLPLLLTAVLSVLAVTAPAASRDADALPAQDPSDDAVSAAVRAADGDGDGIAETLEIEAAGRGTADIEVGVILDRPIDRSTVNEIVGDIDGIDNVRLIPAANAFTATLSADSVGELADHPDVGLVEWDAPVRAANDDATAYAGADTVVDALGYDGSMDGSAGYSRADGVAAVLDTGIDASHPDLDGGKVLAFVDCTGGTCTPVSPFDDDPTGHGTHVAATLAGTGDGTGSLRGVAPGAALVGVKVLGSDGRGSAGDVAEGIDWVIANRTAYGIEVLNLSIEGSSCGSNAMLTTAIEAAAAAGLLSVVAAGNFGPGSCTVTFPGDVGVALTVGSVADPAEGGWGMEATSGRGPSPTGLTKPEVAAPGVDIRSAKPGGGYQNKTGTSMATPYVAGVALLLKDAKSNLTQAQIKSILISTASNFGALTVPNNTYGYGRIDAEAAVLAALGAGSGSVTVEFDYGRDGDVVVVGDWDGDGVDTVGVRRGNVFYLRNSNTGGVADITIGYGRVGDIPVVGDWNGDGIDTLGVRRGSIYYLRNSNSTGIADITIGYGRVGDTPVVGDWNGDGIDTLGVRRGSIYYLRNSNSTGIADITVGYGRVGDIPVVGDWNGDGIDTLGVRRDATYLLRNSNTGGPANIDAVLGTAGDQPAIGDYDADGIDELGVRSGRTQRLAI